MQTEAFRWGMPPRVKVRVGRHSTDASANTPPTRRPTHTTDLVRYKFKEWSMRLPTVGRWLVDCQPTVG